MKWLVVLGCAAGLIGCSDSRPSPAAESPVPADSTVSDRDDERRADLPPLVDPQTFADATFDRPPELPQLIGLTEAEARRWAELSGFQLVNQHDAREGVFAPTIRIVVETDENGVVTYAAAG